MFKVIGLAILVVLLQAAPASAVVLGLDWGLGLSPVKVNYNGGNLNLWVGGLDAYLGGALGAPLPPHDGVYIGRTYCVDLDHLITVPTEYEVEILSSSQLANGGRAAWLFQTFSSGATTNQQAATLQMAIWDVVVDNGDGLTAGSFKYVSGLSSAMATDINTMISASEGMSASARYFKPTGGYGQAMLGHEIPEPATLGLLALALAAMIPTVLRGRKRRS